MKYFDSFTTHKSNLLLLFKTLPCITPIHKVIIVSRTFLNGSLTDLGFQALPRPTIMI